MSDMDVEPDPIVRTALQRLPIPPHTDGFWPRVGDILDAEGPQAAGRTVLVAAPAAPVVTGDEAAPPVEEPEPDPALALVPHALRRPSNGVLLAVAAAAAVVVTLAGTALIEERNGTKEVTTDEAALPSSSADAVPADGQPADDTPTRMTEEGADASTAAVLAWVEDLSAGDGAGAWQAMGQASQAHFGSQDAFEAEMSSLAEGYGAWSEAEPEDVLVTPVRTDAESTIAVVTLVGTVDQEGLSERRAEAFPVRLIGGDAVLEPFALAGAIEVVVPAVELPDDAPDTVEPDEGLVVVVPSDADAPILRVDDGETLVCGEAEGSELTALEGTAGQRCSYHPPQGLVPGEHTLTMAFVGSDGSSISAESMLFDAA